MYICTLDVPSRFEKGDYEYFLPAPGVLIICRRAVCARSSKISRRIHIFVRKKEIFLIYLLPGGLDFLLVVDLG